MLCGWRRSSNLAELAEPARHSSASRELNFAAFLAKLSPARRISRGACRMVLGGWVRSVCPLASRRCARADRPEKDRRSRPDTAEYSPRSWLAGCDCRSVAEGPWAKPLEVLDQDQEATWFWKLGVRPPRSPRGRHRRARASAFRGFLFGDDRALSSGAGRDCGVKKLLRRPAFRTSRSESHFS